MGTPQQIPLVSTTAEGNIAGLETLINIFPKKTDGGKYPYTLTHTPGLAYFLELPTFPILGLHENKERAFAVTPSRFYEIFEDGTYTDLGAVTLDGVVVMADNGIQVVVVDGKKGFFFDANTGVVSEIIADGFYPSRSVTYQDGYFVFDRKDTGQFFLSELLSLFFDPTDFATAEGKPDNLVRVMSDHRELFLFGTKTTEIWYNSGAGDFAFERNQGVFIEKGCAAPYTVAQQNNTIYFVGSDLMVYSMAGYTPIRISNDAVEHSLADVDLSDAFAYTYHDLGILFYVLTIPSNKITWRLDLSTGSWHILKSHQFDRHQINCNTYIWNKNLVGDFQNGRIYQLSNKTYTDDGDVIVREFILPTVNIGRGFIRIGSFELDMTSGVGLVIGQGSDPKALLYFSKDGGITWSNVKSANIGKIGKYLTRVKWNRLGAARQFVFKIIISDPIPVDIGGAYIGVS